MKSMTLPEIRLLFMQAAIISVYAALESMKWGEARWTAYFMQFAGASGALGCTASLIEKRIRAYPDADEILSKPIFEVK